MLQSDHSTYQHALIAGGLLGASSTASRRLRACGSCTYKTKSAAPLSLGAGAMIDTEPLVPMKRIVMAWAILVAVGLIIALGGRVLGTLLG